MGEVNYNNIFFSVVLHVVLLFTFLTLFYWIVITKTEKNSLYSEIDTAIDNSTKKIKISKNIFTDDVKSFMDKLLEGENETYSRNNKLLFFFNIVIIVLLAVVLIASISLKILTKGPSIDILEIIGENILILILVGGIEYFFFKEIASKYVPVMPSYLPSVVNSEIDKTLN